MTPIQPFWFKQRQCKAESTTGAPGENCLKVSGPNLGEALLSIAPEEGGTWSARLRTNVEGPDVASVAGLGNPRLAWEAAFEMYRLAVIV